MNSREEVSLMLFQNYGSRELTIVRGQGVWLYDEQGRDYLDMTAGIAVTSLGHAHPRLVEAISHQAATLLHCSNLYQIPQQEEVAKKLIEFSGLDAAFFCNSGAEANEAALKLARRYASTQHAEKTILLSLPGAFHGRTYGALSVTPKPAYQEGFGPLLPDCHTPTSFEEVLSSVNSDTAACIVEVIQGEGGVQPVPHEFLQELQKRLKAVHALLIVDEVQTGIGRTGDWFAFRSAGLDPDIVTLAKGLGGGVPVGAVLAKQEVAKTFTAGSHGTTFGGNPLAMSAAKTVLEEIEKGNLLEQVRRVGDKVRQFLEEHFTQVSGQGLMWGFTISEDARNFVKNAQEVAGVLMTAVGENRIRVVPPLILEEEDVDEFAKRIYTIL
ncbi:aspartate aminotransferase family protein [Alicyclobacillus sp. TC]|nr:aspartate aminotransferase family protein [Alicyclobacillus sp. TC]